VAGLTGALSLVLAAYGLGALGATPLGLTLVAVAVFGYAVDVQAGAPRAWTVIGTVSLVIGSWSLFPADRRVSWLVITLVLAGTLLFMLRGMTVMVRTRFSTATIRREPLIGDVADVTTAVAPEGVVRLRGALWRARADRAAPIEPGAAARVTGIDGLFLEIEADERRPAGDPSQGD
jgi:membrane-bound serine protease (ClpP class)